MAARAGIRFTTRGASSTIGKVRGVSKSVGMLSKRSKTASFGIGQLGRKLLLTFARVAMVSRGVRGMNKEVSTATSKWKGWGRAMGGPFTQVLSGISKKFAEMRRTLAFYVLGGKEYLRVGKKMAGVGLPGGKQKARGGAVSTAGVIAASSVVGATALRSQASLLKKIQTLFSTTASTVEKIKPRRVLHAGEIFHKPKKVPTFIDPDARIPRKPPRGGKYTFIQPPPIKPPPSGVIEKFKALGGVWGKLITIAKSLVIAFAAVSAALATVYSYAAYKAVRAGLKLAKSFLSVRETFREYEISLGGIIRSTKATAKVMAFATKYAEEYPAMFEDIIDAFRGLASMPTLKPLFRKADYDDLKGIMDVVQGLATLKPQQGVQGAMMALREGLSGQMRSLRMRFEVNVREMAEAAGYSFAEITHDAGKALIAIRKFVELNVPAQAMESMAMTIAVQWGNVYDKYRTFVNEMMRSTGAYWAVVTALKSINVWLGKAFKSKEVIAFSRVIGNHMREVVRAIEQIFGEMEWSKYLKTGDLVGAVRDFCARVRILFAELWAVFGEDAKIVIKEITATMWELFKPAFAMIASSFWTMLKEGANDTADYIANILIAAIGGKKKEFGEVLNFKGVKIVPDEETGKYIVKDEELKAGAQRSKGTGLSERARRAMKWAYSGEEAVVPTKAGVQTSKGEPPDVKDLRGRIRALVGRISEKAKKTEREPVDTGEDVALTINKRNLAALKRKEKIKRAILKTEGKINKLKQRGGKDTQKLVDFEVQLLNLGVEKYEAEEKLINLTKQRKENEKDTGELQKYGGQESEKIINLKRESLKLTDDNRRLSDQIGNADKNQAKIKAQILEIETQINDKQAEIADTRDGIIRGSNAIIKLETRAIDIAKERLDAEQQIAKALERQRDIKSKIQMLEMTIGKRGLGAMDRASGMFGTFKDWMGGGKKSGQTIEWINGKAVDVTGRYSGRSDSSGASMLSWKEIEAARKIRETKIPGMGMPWVEAVTRSTEPETAGIPQFLLKLEEILREKLTSRDLAAPVAVSLLERLYKLNVEQFQEAEGGVAKGQQFLEANRFMEQLITVENQAHKAQLGVIIEQASNVGKLVDGMATANTSLVTIQDQLGILTSQPPPAPAASAAPSPDNPPTGDGAGAM